MISATGMTAITTAIDQGAGVRDQGQGWRFLVRFFWPIPCRSMWKEFLVGLGSLARD